MDNKKVTETECEYLKRIGQERLDSYSPDRLKEMSKRWKATSTEDETEISDYDEEEKCPDENNGSS